MLVRQAFGSGALVVPLTLGLLGVAILIQERVQDAQLSGANALGTLLVLAAILGLLEFPYHAINPADRLDQGGGLIGSWIVEGLDRGIGRPAAVLVVVVLGLAGVMLTFNITLRELIIGLSVRLARFWALLWSAPRRPAAPRRAPHTDADLPFQPPPLGAADDDMVATPIAARPTRASLFQRPGGEPAPAAPGKGAAPPAPAPPAPAAPGKGAAPPALGGARPADPPAAEPSQRTLLPRPASEPVVATVQEALEGFEVSAVHRAWPLPVLEVLDSYSGEVGISDEDIRARSRLIEETLASFKVEAQVVKVNPGPAVTQFELQPAPRREGQPHHLARRTTWPWPWPRPPSASRRRSPASRRRHRDAQLGHRHGRPARGDRDRGVSRPARQAQAGPLGQGRQRHADRRPI